MKIPLTPGQAVTVHGWLHPRVWLTWAEVLADPKLTFGYLHGTCKLAEHSLHLLQPDIAAWVKAGRVELADCPRLGPWDAHPVRDLRADLADLLRTGWGADTLGKAGVTYDDLVGVGLVAENMVLFSGITLAGWASLGFRREHAERVPAAALTRLFGIGRNEVLACLK
jgi:hypothetical protein